MKKIIFVCTGNTCRSPIAEAMAYKVFADNNSSITVLSRGVLVTFPSPANPHSVDIVREDYPAIEGHVATAFTDEEVDTETIVLTMTEQHKQYLHIQYPHLSHQINTYMEYVGLSGDVDDPYGGDREVYDKCAEQIRNLTYQLVKIMP